MTDTHRFRASLGPVRLEDGGWRFRVWAPGTRTVDLHLLEPTERTVRMEPERRGYWSLVVDDVEPGALYRYRLDGDVERPDPASRHQPRGVHGPSEVVDPTFDWSAPGWSGLPLRDHLFYELHVGTFSEEGTFDGAIRHLDHLTGLGVTAVELMPAAQFPGERNWGYDGVYPYAVQSSYGGPEGLKRLVDSCHVRELAVVLDVVYNHLGPEGCYLQDFGPYFTDRYHGPWGAAVNFDGPRSDEVRRYFLENALYWISEFRIDGLRLDAIHGIIDPSARPFLEELADAVHDEADRQRRRVHLVAENDRNDPRIVRDPERGGHDLDALWNDDFHHALHTLLTGERDGYYRDFGALQHLEKALRDGFVFSGQYSRFRRHRHGRSSRDVPAHRMVVFSQNHDQVGNRAQGERLADLVGPEKLKLAAAATILSPYLPLLFMGEEYGELAPFPYFIHHSDPELVEAVREGRRRDFADFEWRGEVPDPQDPETFRSARLDHRRRAEGWHRALFRYYRELVRLRRGLAPLAHPDRERTEVRSAGFQELLTLYRWSRDDGVFLYLHFGGERRTPSIPPPEGVWETLLDSSAEQWGGPGNGAPDRLESGGGTASHRLAPRSAVLLRRIEVASGTTGGSGEGGLGERSDDASGTSADPAEATGPGVDAASMEGEA